MNTQVPQSSVGTFRDSPEVVVEKTLILIGLYEETRNGAHMWNAWRVARLMGDLPPNLMSVFQTYFDECAERLQFATEPKDVAQVLGYANQGKRKSLGQAAAKKQLADAYLLSEFEGMTKFHRLPMSKVEAYRQLAAKYRYSIKAVKQKILDLQGRTQRGKARQ